MFVHIQSGASLPFFLQRWRCLFCVLKDGKSFTLGGDIGVDKQFEKELNGMATWDLSKTKHHVLVCNGGSCLRNQGDEVTLALRAEIAAQGAGDYIHTTRTRCNGRCEDACVVTVYPEGVWYKDMTPEAARCLVREHLLQGNPLQERMVYSYNETNFLPTGRGATGTFRKET
jgi:(2Fe-2S) ferredoxin